MTKNRTLAIIKPDAFARGNAGNIIALLEQRGFKIKAARVLRLSQAQDDIRHGRVIDAQERGRGSRALVQLGKPGLGCKRRVNGYQHRRRGRRAGRAGGDQRADEDR